MSLSSFPRHIRWRVVLRTIACALAFLLVPVLIGGVNFGSKLANAASPADRPLLTGPTPAPTYDSTKRIAVVLSSAYGAEITDALPNYEILARSGAFNVYVVAPEQTVLPFVNSTLRESGLDFVPHFSYAAYEATIGKDPDLIVIPYFPNYTPARDAAVLAWISAHAGPRTIVLGICAGTEILADTGLLDGHNATTNVGWFDKLVPAHPRVHWIRDVRYVDDGPVITSTNLAAGVDATLHTVARLVGRPVAEDVARQLGYTQTGYLDDPSFQYPATPIVPLIQNGMFEWPQEQLGVLLTDGVSEFALAGLLDPYTSSLAATVKVFAPQRGPIRSRDGLVFLPREDFSSVPSFDRVVVPAGDATSERQQAIASWEQRHPNRPVEEIHRNVGHGESAYDATFRDLGQQHNGMVAAAMIPILFVPSSPSALTGAVWPIEPIGADLGLGLLGVGLVLLLGRVRVRRHAPARAFALSHS
jgi:transcriptional regulator GlxA family with amidase domain